MNPRTVEKLGTELTEALTHLTQARNLILGSYNHADEYATEADLKLLKHGEAIIGQLDRLLERLTKYKTEIIQSQDIKEGMTMRVSKEFKRAARKEILRQKRLREARATEGNPHPGIMRGADSLIKRIAKHQRTAKDAFNDIRGTANSLIALEKAAKGAGLTRATSQAGKTFRSVMEAGAAFQDAYHKIDSALQDLEVLKNDANYGR